MIRTYSDLAGHCKNIKTQTVNTIFANKIGLLLDGTRNEPRDLYDILFFFEHQKQFDFDSKKVCKIIKQKYGFMPSLGLLTAQLKNSLYKEKWKYRLAKQIAKLPEVELVLKRVESNLRVLF